MVACVSISADNVPMLLPPKCGCVRRALNPAAVSRWILNQVNESKAQRVVFHAFVALCACFCGYYVHVYLLASRSPVLANRSFLVFLGRMVGEGGFSSKQINHS